MKKQVKVQVNNQHTNNKPVVPRAKSAPMYEDNEEGQGNRVAPKSYAKPSGGEAKITTSSYGEPPKQIQNKKMQFEDIYDEGVENEARFSSHQIVIEDSDWQNIHKEINGEFYDQDFPAEISSIKGHCKQRDGKGSKNINSEDYTFERLSYILEEVNVIKDGIGPHDIFQGELGDCYYLSALSAVAEFPDRIERLLLQRERSEAGGYSVALCITGAWTEIVLDDIFPCKNGGLTYCYTKNHEIWAMLLEKAYAKAFGGFNNIGQGGQCVHALKDITGAPCNFMHLKDMDDDVVLNNILDADKRRYIMSCGSGGQGESKNEYGIIAGHAYTLVGAQKLSNGTILLRIRNPWGRGEWTGDWSDNSSLWTPQLKKEAKWTSEDDGTFFMTYQDFKQNFEDVTVCHYHDDYIYSFIKTENPDETTDVIQFTVHKDGSYYISLSQPGASHFGYSDTEYGYLSCVVIKKTGEGKFAFVEGFSGVDRDVWSKMKLEPGSYLAVIYTNWKHAQNEYTFSAYGPQNIVAKKVYGEDFKSDSIKYFVDALKDKVMACQDNWNNIDFGPDFSGFSSKMEFLNIGYGYYAFQNQNENYTLGATVTLSGENVESLQPQIEGDKWNLTIPQGSNTIAVYRFIDVPNMVNLSAEFNCS